MIVVTIDLLNAKTGKKTTLGRMLLTNRNTTGDPKRGDYNVYVKRKDHLQFQTGEAIDDHCTRKGEVLNYPRLSYNVWRLIAKALKSCFPEEG